MPSAQILEVNGGGIALFDYDNDGDIDLFLANGATLDAPTRGPGSRLFANRGDGRFDDATLQLGLDLPQWAMGVAVGDYDGDGWDDLYVTCFGPNVLLHNEPGSDGGRRFVDVTDAAGVAGSRWSTSAGFSDLDGDLDLDLFVVNYLEFDPKHPPARAGKFFKGVPVMAGPRGLAAQPDALYENLGGGRFRDVSSAAGVSNESEDDYGLSLRILDFDRDGLPDIFVGNDSSADQLFHNLGNLVFEETAVSAGIAANGTGTTQATMGVGQVDADGNGYVDLFLTVFSDDTNTLSLNLGDGFFDDRSAQFGLGAVSRSSLGWGCGFYDFDLDGDEDLFIANGHVYPQMDTSQLGASWAQSPSLLERQDQRFRATDCTQDWCRARYHGRATAFGDIDGDRDVDILMTTLNGPVIPLRNNASGTSSLVVRLVGTDQNHRALGSLVELEIGSTIQRRWLSGGGSFQSIDEPSAFFGLGSRLEQESIQLKVHWPGGRVSQLMSPPTDRQLVLVHPGRSEQLALVDY